jgi:peptide/nickel transport system substrate-binding protein
MNRRDQAVLAALGAILLLVALSLGLPSAIAPAQRESSAAPTGGSARPYVEGMPGPLDQVSPLSARSQAERNAVALAFSGLVKLGPGQTVLPDLAESWETDPSGARWTFHLRPDTAWHDGVPFGADDVAFTVRTLRSADYSGPGGASWKEVSVTVIDRLTVRFDLATPLGGFLQAATQPIVPMHVLEGIPPSVLSSASSPFGRQPVGTGPFRVVSVANGRARFLPATRPRSFSTAAPNAGGSPTPPVDALRTDPPPLIPPRPTSLLTGIELRTYDTAAALAAAYRAGEVDAASGLTLALDAELAREHGTRLIRYPGTTLMAVVLDLRRTHPQFRDATVRRALLMGIDRDSLVTDSLGGFAVRADGLLPPSSWAFDADASAPVGYDQAAATAALDGAGWKQASDGWRPAGFDQPVVTELLSPDGTANPAAFAMAEAVASDWRRLGLTVNHVGLSPAELSSTRLRAADFDAVLLSVNVGLDPDLYPLLASTQTTTTGSNISGLQDPALDSLLVAARGPGTLEARKAAYAALQGQLSAGTYLLPLAFRDVVVVASDRLTGPVVRTVGDPADRFWDVLTWRLAVGR